MFSKITEQRLESYISEHPQRVDSQVFLFDVSPAEDGRAGKVEKAVTGTHVLKRLRLGVQR